MMNRKRGLLAAGGLAVAVAALLLVYLFFMPKGEAGYKSLQVLVVLSAEEQRAHTIRTDREMLGEALMDAGLIEGTEGAYGLYISMVDGVTADEANKQWWCITRGGELVTTGVDSTPIRDGEKYELTLSTY